MNKHFVFFLFLFWVAMASLTSCQTQTFTVYGTPGTVISYNQKQLAVIDQTGTAQITTRRREGYHHFYQAQAPGSDVKVPFAMDYTDRHWARVANVVYPLAMVSLVGLPFLGTYGLINIHDLPGSWDDYNGVLRQQYNYLKHQSTNNDLIR